jgi:hypothetical protein
MQVSLLLKRPGLVQERTGVSLEPCPYAGIIRIRFTGFVREDISGRSATPWEKSLPFVAEAAFNYKCNAIAGAFKGDAAMSLVSPQSDPGAFYRLRFQADNTVQARLRANRAYDWIPVINRPR